jgi:hypothetical protein
MLAGIFSSGSVVAEIIEIIYTDSDFGLDLSFLNASP